MTIIRFTRNDHTYSIDPPIITSTKEKKLRTPPECKDCGRNVYVLHEYCYMISQLLWELYCSSVELICVDCLEKRIGRQLVASDFPDVTLNTLDCLIRSELLLKRMNCD